MNATAIEKTLIKLKTIEKHLNSYEHDPLLVEDYHESITQLQMQYGHEMNEILFSIYDEYCEDDPIRPFTDYIHREGVEVEADDFPGVKAHLILNTHPLRFELQHPKGEYKQVVWSLAS